MSNSGNTKMESLPNDKAPSLNETDPIHITKDGPASRSAKKAEAEYQTTSNSGSGSREASPVSLEVTPAPNRALQSDLL